jgi:predicted enzyme involved in methoxymalonyl-ACP biosynthesis
MSRTLVTDLRAEIENALASEDWRRAHAALDRLLSAERTSATASFAIARYERLRPHLTLAPCRVAILRSFTVEPLVPLLRAAAFAGGLDIEVQVGSFDNYAQQILDPGSELYGFGPDVVILAVQTRDMFPVIWDGFNDLDAGETRAAAEEFLE